MSVTEDQQKQYILIGTQCAVSLAAQQEKLEIGDLCKQQLHVSYTGTNTSSLDRWNNTYALTLNGHLHIAACS